MQVLILLFALFTLTFGQGCYDTALDSYNAYVDYDATDFSYNSGYMDTTTEYYNSFSSQSFSDCTHDFYFTYFESVDTNTSLTCPFDEDSYYYGSTTSDNPCCDPFSAGSYNCQYDLQKIIDFEFFADESEEAKLLLLDFVDAYNDYVALKNTVNLTKIFLESVKSISGVSECFANVSVFGPFLEATLFDGMPYFQMVGYPFHESGFIPVDPVVFLIDEYLDCVWGSLPGDVTKYLGSLGINSASSLKQDLVDNFYIRQECLGLYNGASADCDFPSTYCNGLDATACYSFHCEECIGSFCYTSPNDLFTTQERCERGGSCVSPLGYYVDLDNEDACIATKSCRLYDGDGFQYYVEDGFCVGACDATYTEIYFDDPTKCFSYDDQTSCAGTWIPLPSTEADCNAYNSKAVCEVYEYDDYTGEENYYMVSGVSKEECEYNYYGYYYTLSGSWIGNTWTNKTKNTWVYDDEVADDSAYVEVLDLYSFYNYMEYFVLDSLKGRFVFINSAEALLLRIEKDIDDYYGDAYSFDFDAGYIIADICDDDFCMGGYIDFEEDYFVKRQSNGKVKVSTQLAGRTATGTDEKNFEIVKDKDGKVIGQITGNGIKVSGTGSANVTFASRKNIPKNSKYTEKGVGKVVKKNGKVYVEALAFNVTTTKGGVIAKITSGDDTYFPIQLLQGATQAVSSGEQTFTVPETTTQEEISQSVVMIVSLLLLVVGLLV